MNEANYTFITRKNRTRKTSQVSSDTDLANKINLFEKTSPKDILRILQGGTKVAPSDFAIINTLSKDYQLSNGVINVILDFVLSMNKNVLSRAYIEKIAASFNREGIETTFDAMNYCNAIVSGKSNRKPSVKKSAEKSTPAVEKKSTKVSKEEWDSLFEESEDEDDGKIESELPF